MTPTVMTPRRRQFGGRRDPGDGTTRAEARVVPYPDGSGTASVPDGQDVGSALTSSRACAKAAAARSRSSRVWAADIWVRMRALPFGTTG